MTALISKLMGLEAAPTRIPEPDLRLVIADRLSREFDAPVGLLDASERIWLIRQGAGSESFPDAESCVRAIEERRGQETAFLWRPGDGESPTWLVFWVCMPGDQPMVALAGFAKGEGGASERAPWGPPCPAAALRAWGQEVSDRLRMENESLAASDDRSTRALIAGGPVIDSLIRRLRISDPPERFQRMAARTMREELGAAAVAWVPGSPREPVAIDGAVDGLGVEAYRSLIPEPTGGEMAYLTDVPVGGEQYRAAIVAADREDPAGWLVALRPSGELPFLPEELELLRSIAPLLAAQRLNARLYADLKELLFGVIRALTSAIDAKDPYTSGHSERVARIAVRLGEQLGMSPNQRGDLYLMGLHDVGKIGIEDGVLKKPEKLTTDEYRLIQSHVKIGVHILSDLKKLHHLLPGVAHHHEAVDGTGYPSGLRGDSIPLAARILTVADAFDAMSSSRPYRRRLPAHESIGQIFRDGAGRQWDPRVIEALMACREDIERIRSKGLGDSLRQVVGETLGRNEMLR